jgi:hypothetical protein
MHKKSRLREGVLIPAGMHRIEKCMNNGAEKVRKLDTLHLHIAYLSGFKRGREVIYRAL